MHCKSANSLRRSMGSERTHALGYPTGSLKAQHAFLQRKQDFNWPEVKRVTWNWRWASLPKRWCAALASRDRTRRLPREVRFALGSEPAPLRNLQIEAHKADLERKTARVEGAAGTLGFCAYSSSSDDCSFPRALL